MTISLTGDGIMQHPPNGFDFVLIMIAAIAGIVGGCGAASRQILSGGTLSMAILLAYATLGGALGLFSFAIFSYITEYQEPEMVIILAMALGFGGTATLAGIRWGIRALLKWRGIEVDIEVKRTQRTK